MPDDPAETAAIRAALERIRPHVRPHPWYVASGRGVPPDRPGVPPGVVVTYLAGDATAEAAIRRVAAAEAQGVPVYAVPGAAARPLGAGRPG